MNTRKSGMICLMLTLCSFYSFAQQNVPINEPDYNKPTLFHDLPEKLAVSVPAMEGLLTRQVGQNVSATVSTNFLFNGTVVSVSDAQDNNVKSVVIRSTNRPGARLTFSRITQPNGEVVYLGRIISREHIDSYEIALENGQYFFVKKGYHDLVIE